MNEKLETGRSARTMNRSIFSISRFSRMVSNFGFQVSSLILSAHLVAQVPDAPAPAPAAPAPASAPAKSGESKFLGKDVPAFDPGSELLTWDGKTWNVNNNRLFQARFEKYLSAPEETAATDRAYQAIINEILFRLSPAAAKADNRENINTAFRLLPRASTFEIDARLCDAIADSVYTVWRSQRRQDQLAMANEALEQERKKHEWNAQLAGQDKQIEQTATQSSSSKQGAATITNSTETKQTMAITPYATRLAETMALIKANQAKIELSEIQVKVEFQALIVQLFLQRRYQHVLMATRFYRAVFNDGDSKLNLGKESKDLFEKSSGSPPTVSTLDALANEAIRDVREGVKTFEFLLQNNELESATKRLAEAFTVGEWVPEIRTLPRAEKRQALEFVQKSNQLLSSMEAKDYTKAEGLLKDLAKIAKDFDGTKASAGIETARRIAQMRLAKARNAALSGDRATLEQEMAAATELWPLNPKLAEVSDMISSQGDVQQKAVVDFEQLLGQKNYRQIFDNSPRYIAALALYPDKQKQLEDVLRNMQKVEGAILRADEMAKQSNYAGAWESVEKVAGDFPDDSKLNQMRANLTTQAADFVRTLRSAQDFEKKDQVGSSLAWYLKAKKIYPQSDYAGEGIERLAKKIVPEG
jgi:tetratricopeptide (TPR) repeat protein